MVDETRTVVKDFNRDLLVEELLASIVPFQSLDMAGFHRRGNFVAEPNAGPVVVFHDKVNNITDTAQPGEIRFVVTSVLSGLEAAALDAALSSHLHTNRTADQARLEQDQTDLDTLETNYPNWDSFTAANKDAFLKTLSRVVIREARKSDF